MEFRVITAAAAYALPGSGYLLLGSWRRALAVDASVLGLVAGGLLIGGVDVIDAREDRWWFFLQAGAGPGVFALDYAHQHHLKGIHRGQLRSPDPGERVVTEPDPRGGTRRVIVNDPQGPLTRKSIGRGNEIGSLYVAVGGLLNLIAVVDCLTGGHSSRRRTSHTTPQHTQKASA